MLIIKLETPVIPVENRDAGGSFWLGDIQMVENMGDYTNGRYVYE